MGDTVYIIYLASFLRHRVHCAGFSELGADDSVEADGIISGFRRRRVYTRYVLYRIAASIIVRHSIVTRSIINISSRCNSIRAWLSETTTTQGNRQTNLQCTFTAITSAKKISK